MFKKLLVVLMCLGMISCAGVSDVGVTISDDATEILTDGVISAVGYLIVKNNPQLREPLRNWYLDFIELKELDVIQKAYQEGISGLIKSVSHDPFLVMQIQNAMKVVQIDATGPMVELDIGKYQRVVDAFMLGVMTNPILL